MPYPRTPDEQAVLLEAFAEAVERSAAALGLPVASAYWDTVGYRVAYQTPQGHLVCSEAHHDQRKALLAFESHAQHSLLLHH